MLEALEALEALEGVGPVTRARSQEKERNTEMKGSVLTSFYPFLGNARWNRQLILVEITIACG